MPCASTWTWCLQALTVTGLVRQRWSTSRRTSSPPVRCSLCTWRTWAELGGRHHRPYLLPPGPPPPGGGSLYGADGEVRRVNAVYLCTSQSWDCHSDKHNRTLTTSFIRTGPQETRTGLAGNNLYQNMHCMSSSSLLLLDDVALPLHIKCVTLSNILHKAFNMICMVWVFKKA